MRLRIFGRGERKLGGGYTEVPTGRIRDDSHGDSIYHEPGIKALQKRYRRAHGVRRLEIGIGWILGRNRKLNQ